MEIANDNNIGSAEYFYRKKADGTDLWQVQESDFDQVERLVEAATWRHKHVDWFDPKYWMGGANFLMSRSAEGALGCLAIGADPLPGAWLRMIALERHGYNSKKSFEQLLTMMEAVIEYLATTGVTTIGWMAPIAWPDQWPEKLGFIQSEQIITYQKPTYKVPELASIPNLHIRKATAEDAPALAEIEERTYIPLWRHSTAGLTAAMNQAFSFDVVELNGKLVGFQHSVMNRGSSVHLARITVDPNVQGLGIGSHLLRKVVMGYQKRGIMNMTLNTESANTAAQRLYKRFGYKPNGHRFPMYTMEIG